MCVLIKPLIFFQTPPGGAFAVPQQIGVLIGHLTQDADLVAVEVVGLLASFASEGIAFYGNVAVAVTFAVATLSIGVDAVDKFAVFVETVHFRPPQCVRCGRVGRPVGKCHSRNRLRQTAAVRRRRGRRFGRGRLKVGFQMTSISTNASIGNGIGLLKNGCFRDGLTGFVLGLDPTYLLWLA